MSDWKLPDGAIIGAVGAAIAAALFVVARFFGEPPPGPRDLVQAVVEAALAIISGAAAAHWLAPSLASWEVMGFGLDASASAFLIGLVFWRVTPAVLHGLTRFARTAGGRIDDA